MSLADVFAKGLKLVKANSPEILTALGVTGVATTAYLTFKASWKASREIDTEEQIREKFSAPDLTLKEKAQIVWPLFVPPVAAGVVTIACIVGASKANAQRTAAAVTAYSLTETAFSEYRDKIVEQIGKGKEQKARDELAQAKVDSLPASKQIVIIGKGEVLCCELHTGRFFRSDMESLRKAENFVNGMLVREIYATLDDFYHEIGLSSTSTSGHLGWEVGQPVELNFSTVLREGEPCLAFDYSYYRPLP